MTTYISAYAQNLLTFSKESSDTLFRFLNVFSLRIQWQLRSMLETIM